MNKVLLLLAIFCAISYASISPKYTDVTKDGPRNYNVTELTAQSSPVKGQWNTINFCGFVKADLNLTRITYEVGVNYGTQQETHYKAGSLSLLGDKTLYAGAFDCEFFSFQVPHFDGSQFYVLLNLYAFDGSSKWYDSYQNSIKIDFDV